MPVMQITMLVYVEIDREKLIKKRFNVTDLEDDPLKANSEICCFGSSYWKNLMLLSGFISLTI